MDGPWGVLDIEVEPETDHLLNIGWLPQGGAADDWAAALPDSRVLKVCHTTYDVVWLRRHGYEVQGAVWDTSVMAWLLDENQPLSLEYLTKRWLRYDPDKRLRRRGGRVWFRCDDGTEVPIGEAPREQLVAYNARDLEATRDLAKLFYNLLEQRFLLDHFLQEQVPFTATLIDMETAGLPIDVEATRRLAAELRQRADELGQELVAEAGLPPGAFNIGSGDQLAAYLYSEVCALPGRLLLSDELRACRRKPKRRGEVCGAGHTSTELCEQFVPPPGFEPEHFGRDYVTGTWYVPGRGLEPVEVTESGERASTSTAALLMAAHSDPWVTRLIEWRKLTKLLTTYLEKFPLIAKDGRIYGHWSQTGTVTGRLSSSRPNLQNIPARGDLGRAVRALFRGNLIVGDYSQLEPRLMAHFSQDPRLLHIYHEGLDIYLATARAIHGRDVEYDSPERFEAKTLVLAMGYGAGPAKLARILTLNGHPTSVDRAQELLEELRRLYKVFFDWREAVIRFAHNRGYVRTIGGRVRRLRGAFADRRNFKAYGHGERQAVNSIIQGSAADIVRRAMVAVHEDYPFLRLLAQVHDELVWEYDPDELQYAPEAYLEGLRWYCENRHDYDLAVPLEFSLALCKTWADKGSSQAVELDDEEEEERVMDQSEDRHGGEEGYSGD